MVPAALRKWRAGALLLALLWLLYPASSVLAQVREGRLTLSDPTRIYSLIGDWSFKTGVAEIDANGPRFVRIPSPWRRSGVHYDGVAVYSLELAVSEVFRGHNLAVAVPSATVTHELWFNGVLLGGRGQVAQNGTLIEPNTQAALHIVPRDLVRFDRANTVEIRVRSLAGVGGFVTTDTYIGAARLTQAYYERHRLWSALLCGLFFFVGGTHLISFAGRRNEIHYLLFALFSLAVGSLAVGLNTLAYYVIDSYILHQLFLNQGLATFALLMLLFFHKYFDIRLNWFAAPVALICLSYSLLALLSLVYTPAFYYLNLIGVPVLLSTIVLVIAYTSAQTIYAIRKRRFGARVIGIGFLFFGLAVINDIFSYQEIIDTPRWLDEGFLVFVFTMAIAVSFKFSHVHRELENLYQKLTRSERQYRTLVENTQDIIFTIDAYGKILMVNRALRHQLNYPAKQVVNRPIYDLLYRENQNSSVGGIAHYLLKSKLEEVVLDRKGQSLMLQLANRNAEPREYELYMDYVESESGPQILGRARAVTENELTQLRTSQIQRYEIGNYLSLAEALCHRIALDLTRYLSYDEAMSVKTCLREIVINSIEHGNLAISFEEKTEAQNSGRYFEFIRERQNDPRYRDRRVLVLFALNEKRLRLYIEDDGDGFDHRAMMGRNPDDVNAEGLSHGRGLFMVRDEFDLVRYNEKGNAVVLMKRFKKPDPGGDP
ncbi:MAG: ATP-binding protein [Leptospiraceae bacterium]|nr:ATP-binding protein [Leptospiraceae bacterium]